MNAVGAYNNYQKNAENMEFVFFNIKEYGVKANAMAAETNAVTEGKKIQDNFQNIEGIDTREVSWGRVMQKENDAKKANAPFVCAFVEKPTAVELFEKDRTMDKRNVEERAFSTGGKLFDFTV